LPPTATLSPCAAKYRLLGTVLPVNRWRAFVIATLAERNALHFHAFLAYGLGIWIGLQAFINIGVNMGVLPTKGLTLPLMSYGGSSLVITFVALALLLRIGYEATEAELMSKPLKRRKR
jgi:cell division protein FtsW